MNQTVPDCSLDGRPIPLDRLPLLTSDEISRVVGQQQPGSVLEDARHYRWSYQKLFLEELRESTCDGDEPEGGWKAMYVRQKQSDEAAVRSGSPEYAGRQQWCEKWASASGMYPLFVVKEDDRYYLWDGHHRLASAFWHEVPYVWAFVGIPLQGLN